MTKKKVAPQGVKRQKKEVSDSWSNELTGMGTYSRDKRTRTAPRDPICPDHDDLAKLYNGSWLAKKIIRKPVKTALRKSWQVLGLEEEQLDALWSEYKRLEFPRLLKEALYWDSLYGGSVIVVGASDGNEDLSKPLSEGSVAEIRFLQVVPRPWCHIESVEFGKPTMFRVGPDQKTAFRLHPSRAIWFNGGDVTPDERIRNQGWGLSALTPIYEIIRDFESAYNGAFSISEDFAQAVYKMTGLAEALSQKQGSAIKSRLEAMDMARSIIQALVLDADSGEEFERKTTNIAGLPELLTKFDSILASAVDIPATVLFGKSPDGMNSTGDADLENWYSRVEEDQEDRIQPAIERLTSLLLPMVQGWEISFPPLNQLSEAELAQVHLTQAQADQTYHTMGVLSAQEIRDSRFSGDYSVETTLGDGDIDEERLSELIASLETEPEPEDG